MRTTRTKRKKTKSGKSLFLLLPLVLVLIPVAIAAKKDKHRADAPDTFAVIAGTVYRPPGFAVAGSQVTVTPESGSPEGSRLKPTKAVTDRRGEFAVRVPAVPMRYRVDVQKDSYSPQHKIVSVEGEQRHDLSFILDPEANAQGGAK